MPRQTKQKREAELVEFMRRTINQSTWADDSEVQANYRAALDSYYSRNKPKVTDGCSTAVSTDVADMVEAVTAQIMTSFDFAEIGHFPPINAEDVDQARVESMVVNDYVMGKNDGYTVFQEAVRNAALLRNGIIKVWAEERIRTQTKRYTTELTDLALGQELMPQADGETRELVSEPGNPTAIRITTPLRRLSLRSIDPINFLCWREYQEHDLVGCPSCGERYFLSESELRQRGHSAAALKDIPSTSVDLNPSSFARNRGSADPVRQEAEHEPTRLIECFEMYVHYDYDRDGIAELRRVLFCGGVQEGRVLENSPWSRVPYASGTGFLAPQRWLGISLFDKLQSVEDVKSEALRQWLDNLAYANNAEVVVIDGAVEMDDFTARRPGGVNRADEMGAWQEMTLRSNGAESLQLLEYMDTIRSERGGAALDLQTANAQIAGETAHGVERQFESREMLAQLMTRTIAETLVRQVLSLAHDTLRREFPNRAEQNAGGAFVSIEPGRWRFRDEIEVTAGIGQAQRLQRRAALEAILVQQEKLAAGGMGSGILTDLPQYHAALLDWSASAGIPDGRRYWIDPRSPNSLQAQQAQQRAAQLQQALEQQRFGQVLQSQVQIEGTKVAGDLANKADELAFKYWDASLDAAVEEAKLDENAGEVDQLQRQGEARSVA